MIYFVSDLHLGLGERASDRQREELFLQFLRCIRRDCEMLFIVGDLFDYWFEYNTAIPKKFFRTLTALANLHDSGIPIHYLMGNHDFGHKHFFREELGIDVIKTDMEMTLHGKKFYLAHGDGKAYNDTGYLILRAVLRHPLSLWLYKWLHPDVGIKLASSTSHTSREYTGNKDYSGRDGLRDFAEKKIQEGFDYVVMGHRHRPESTAFGTGTYINLGDWLHHRTFASFDGTDVTIHKVEEFLAECEKKGTPAGNA